MQEICDCCGKVKPDVATQTIKASKFVNMCKQCAEEAKKPNTSARRWLEQKRTPN